MRNIGPDGAELPNGNGRLLPLGIAGALVALPFAVWRFTAIEQPPLAAEESVEPKRDMPKGMILGMRTLIVAAFMILSLGVPGAVLTIVIAAVTIDVQPLDLVYRIGVQAVAVWIAVGIRDVALVARHRLILSPEEAFALAHAQGATMRPGGGPRARTAQPPTNHEFATSGGRLAVSTGLF